MDRNPRRVPLEGVRRPSGHGLRHHPLRLGGLQLLAPWFTHGLRPASQVGAHAHEQPAGGLRAGAQGLTSQTGNRRMAVAQVR